MHLFKWYLKHILFIGVKEVNTEVFKDIIKSANDYIESNLRRLGIEDKLVVLYAMTLSFIGVTLLMAISAYETRH